MAKKTLIIHIPVIHKGYLDFFALRKGDIGETYLIREDLLGELTQCKPDIASLNTETAKQLLEKLGFSNISVLSIETIQSLKGRNLLLIQDEVSRNLYEKYLQGQSVEWASVFLRWNKEKVLTERPLDDIPESADPFDISMMNEARKEAQKTGDWWRQIGAVLVKNKEILIRGYNRDLPSDHTPYQVGEVRDFFKAGEKHELASTIHAEENVIAQAAQKGIAVEEASLYVSTFPCPVCAKLIACSGIKTLYFSEGGSSFDAKKVLESAGITLVHIPRRV
ncbi:MAG: hypothetical protein HYS60_00450 [Candidatus Wildermuthbacteria bacterium]|nr:hypothetical protein [Candidatus Wildermuthbacteria bacterium]